MWGAVFPGQGSQHSGMGKFLYDNFSFVKPLFEEASDLLSLDFKKLCFDGPESELALTENTQPALLLVSVASYQVLKELANFTPKAVAGHSIGEYGAVVAAGSLEFAEALKAVRKRGEYMQSAVPVGQGGMLAVIGLSTEQVNQLCSWTEETSEIAPIEPANYNAPGQIVISGSLKAIKWLRDNFKPEIFESAPKKVRLIPLKVSAPFHCSMMQPAADNMKTTLEDMSFKDAAFPVVQNFTAKPVTNAGELRNNLIDQIVGAVKWVDCIENLKELGVKKNIEVGCGRVLSGLIKKIDSENLTTFNMNSLEDIKAIEAELK